MSTVDRLSREVGKNQVEKLELKDQLKQSLEEMRIVMPGVQALFGFQLIAVFNDVFAKQLTRGEQNMHLAAITLTAISVALNLAPSAIHRQSEPDKVSTRLVACSSLLLTAGLVPLTLALMLDFYLLCRLITHDLSVSIVMAVVMLTLFVSLWMISPHLLRRWLTEGDETVDARQAEDRMPAPRAS